jgi:hypothetical protein
MNIKRKLKYQLNLINLKENHCDVLSGQSLESTVDNTNYVFLSKSITKPTKLDHIDREIDKFHDLVSSCKNFECLKFWRENEYQFPCISRLAKKFLGVQASSCQVERMFSISGHIFSNKRRKTGVRLFENLVFLKLNEQFLY